MKSQWLDHLTNAIPIEAQRNRISLYTIALEGWRRGLTLTFHITRDQSFNERLIYSLSCKDKVHYFSESSGDKNVEQAHNICHDKNLTNKYLLQNNVPIPRSMLFQSHISINEIINKTKPLSYPLVVKPTDGSSGQGVIVNINTEEVLRSSIKHLRGKLNYKNLIVQEHIEGDELRFYVLNGKVLAVTNRRPANIVGDGQSTIAELIKNKNQTRKLSPHLRFRPIRIDQEVRQCIEASGYTLDTVLENEERLYLRKISNISTGGEAVNVTHQVTKKQRDIAKRAAQSIPGLTHCGIDMIITGDTGVVLEINTRPGIGMHMFPSEGAAIDISKEIIDYYFSETANRNAVESNVYFDLQTVFDAIYNGYVTEIKLKQHPEKNLETKKLELSSDLDLGTFYNKIKKQIVSCNIYGHIKQNSNKTIELLLGHENKNELADFKQFLMSRKNSLQIKDMKLAEWNQPIKMTFEVIDGYRQMGLSGLESEQTQLQRQFKTIELETNRLARRITLTENSTSWKITSVLRKVRNLFNRN